jgi:hypothetical protein
MAKHKVANHHWFVSVETPRQSRRGIRLHVRQTKAFPTEAEAKQFAKEMLSDETKIELGIRRLSPKNGNIRGSGWRLLPNRPQISRIRESGDLIQNCKSPPMAGLSATIRASLSDLGTGWLGWEDSNLHLPFGVRAAAQFIDRGGRWRP